MKIPSILNGIIVAALITLAAGVSSLLFGAFIRDSSLFTLLLSFSTCVYLIYLLKYSEAQIGRVMVMSTWAVITLGSGLLTIPFIEQVLIQAGLIWLVRSLYFHDSLWTALLDFGLILAGLAASTWAMMNTGSLAIALWSFFLLQSLFTSFSHLALRPKNRSHTSSQPSFQSSHRAALEAVRKLSQPSDIRR